MQMRPNIKERQSDVDESSSLKVCVGVKGGLIEVEMRPNIIGVGRRRVFFTPQVCVVSKET